MKYDVRIKFYNREPTEISSADKVELLIVGRGVLSVITGKKNHCFSLDTIQWYVITNKEES